MSFCLLYQNEIPSYHFKLQRENYGKVDLVCFQFKKRSSFSLSKLSSKNVLFSLLRVDNLLSKYRLYTIQYTMYCKVEIEVIEYRYFQEKGLEIILFIQKKQKTERISWLFERIRLNNNIGTPIMRNIFMFLSIFPFFPVLQQYH